MDVIVTVTSPGTKAAKDATMTVPIVMVGITDPVGQGLIQSLARPGGNITGSTDDTGLENVAKRLQILKELLPPAPAVAYLGLGSQLQATGEQKAFEAAAQILDVRILSAEHLPNDYTGAFALIERERADALFVSQSGANFANRRHIVEFASKNRLPAVYPHREYAGVGGLIAYGMEAADQFRRAAGHVDKILKGVSPSDIPVEQPTKFELVINLKTAKALGIAIPPSLLARADEVIE